MVRRYEEPIEVRQGRAGADGCPDAFVWRGRLYVVRAVLDHWQERRAWWRDARDPGGGPRDERAGEGSVHEGSDVLTAARERRVWRVEASAGRLAGVGVYDLGAVPHDDLGAVPHDDLGAVPHDDLGAVPHDDLGAVPHDVDAGRHQWRLLRVAD